MNRGKPEKYIALAEKIRLYIQNEKLKKNDPLPPERKMSSIFGINHLTLRKALRLLEQQKLIYKEPSIGNFVGTKPYSGKCKQLVGMIFPDHEIFYYNIFSELEEKLAAEGMHTVIHLTHNIRKKEEDILDFMEHEEFAAIFAVPNPACVEKYKTLSIPLIFFDVFLNGINAPRIISDDYNGAVMATRHLISLGHDRIAHIGSVYERTAELRLRGLLDTLKENKITIPHGYMKQKEASRHWGYTAAAELFALKTPPTAILCGNDTIASGARKYCHENKISIPSQCSIGGFGDTSIAEDIDLTSVSQHSDKIADALWNALRLKLGGENPPEETLIPTSLIVRGSTGKLKGK